MSVRRLSIVLFALSTLVFFVHFIAGGSKGPNDNTLLHQDDRSSFLEDLQRELQTAAGPNKSEKQNTEVDLKHSSTEVEIVNEKESTLLLLDPSEWCLAAKEGYEALVERIGRLDQLLSVPPAKGFGVATTNHAGAPTPLVQQLNADLFNVSDLKGSLSKIMRNFLEIPLHGDDGSSSVSKREIEISSQNCYAKARDVIKRRHLASQAGHYGSKDTNSDSTVDRGKRRLFIDMGSRSGDQTTMFLRKFPEASSYEIHCFEANPAFNQWYVANSQPNLIYHNEAVGVVNTSMWLSDRDVGSSIVDGKGKGSRGIEVKVIDFSHFLIQTALFPHHQRSESESFRRGHPTKIIIKMDIEKMEYSVLLKMFTTGAFLLVDDLLLECHYTTNKRRGTVDRPDGAICKEDCKDFVHALNVGMNAWQQSSRPNHADSSSVTMSTDANDNMRFEAVLWNSVKTARSSGYIARNGGFMPT